MATIHMTGWREGMKKVSLTQLQRELLNLSLKQAKDNVDKLLDGEHIKIEFHNTEVAKEFVKQANEIGVDCTIEI